MSVRFNEPLDVTRVNTETLRLFSSGPDGVLGTDDDIPIAGTVSYREEINSAFLTMAIANGLTSAITNPLESEIRAAVMAADVLNGNDPDCASWIRAHRQPGEDGGRTRRRRRATSS